MFWIQQSARQRISNVNNDVSFESQVSHLNEIETQKQSLKIQQVDDYHIRGNREHSP